MADRAERADPEPTRIVLRPKAVDDAGFTVEPDPAEAGAFIVRGEKPERWIRQTAFDNDEAVGYLADRLARLGVEAAADEARCGAGRRGDDRRRPVRLRTGRRRRDEYVPTRRGSDPRIDPSKRIRANERLAAKRARRADDDSRRLDVWSRRSTTG